MTPHSSSMDLTASLHLAFCFLWRMSGGEFWTRQNYLLIPVLPLLTVWSWENPLMLNPQFCHLLNSANKYPHQRIVARTKWSDLWESQCLAQSRHVFLLILFSIFFLPKYPGFMKKKKVGFLNVPPANHIATNWWTFPIFILLQKCWLLIWCQVLYIFVIF